MWDFSGKLRRRGIIGMNQRNISFIGRHNPRHLYPLVDDKLKTKILAQHHGVPTPGLVGIIRSQFEVRGIARLVADKPGFAIKPAKGSGGKGILIIERRDGDTYVKPSGKHLDRGDLERHVSNILSGLYSLAGVPDAALIEDLIVFDHVLFRYSYEGVPDIRVILFRGYPVMSMVRLSTSTSDGKANLHQGAVGVGLDIATGTAIKAVQFNRPVRVHPDSGLDLSDLEIPDWDQLLELAVRCYEMTGLGYLGVDIVLDRNRGPLLLELNARPGLTIQMTNGEGLRGRLSLVEQQPDGCPPAERIAFAKRHFGRKLPDPLRMSEG